VLFSSHQLDLVEHLCEEVAIVDHGRLVVQGSVEELAHGGRSRLAVRVVADHDGRWAAGLRDGAQVESVDAGTVIVALDGADGANAVLDVARAAGTVEHFAFERRRLSEVFRESVRRPRAAA
jgi:ABC-2 type transport system ATP-binding protein